MVSNQGTGNPHLAGMRHIQGFSSWPIVPLPLSVSDGGAILLPQGGAVLKEKSSQESTGQHSDFKPKLTQRDPKSSQETLVIEASWPAQHQAQGKGCLLSAGRQHSQSWDRGTRM